MRKNNGQTALTGLVLDQSWMVTIQKESGLKSVGLFLKKIYLYYIN